MNALKRKFTKALPIPMLFSQIRTTKVIQDFYLTSACPLEEVWIQTFCTAKVPPRYIAQKLQSYFQQAADHQPLDFNLETRESFPLQLIIITPERLKARKARRRRGRNPLNRRQSSYKMMRKQIREKRKVRR
jgi:hypothetical protein